MLRRAPSRGRGRRAAVDIVACFGWDGFFRVFLFIYFFIERTRPAASMRPPCLIYLYTSNSIFISVRDEIITSWSFSTQTKRIPKELTSAYIYMRWGLSNIAAAKFGAIN